MRQPSEITHNGKTLAEWLEVNKTEDANLSRAYLSGANLSGADLGGANLSGANLSRAYLSGANLSGADLGGAYLSGANLSGADLSGAYLSGANLSGADLSGADLSGANLSGADLSGAYLSGANLSGADLSDVKGTDLVFARLRILPDTGDIIGYKKLRGDLIATLLIPNGTPRSNATGRKCRAKSVKVLAITSLDGKTEHTEGYSSRNQEFKYVVGETAECDNWDERWWEECSGGIHFFITRIEAENY